MNSLQTLKHGFKGVPDELAQWLDAGAAAKPAFRSADPGATLRAALGLAPAAGITRIADITGLDAIGIPVVAVLRPNGRSLSVASGKGPSLPEACASGLVEALELFHAETFADAVPPDSLAGDALLPDLAALPQMSRAAPITDWGRVARVARGTELNSGRAAAVPFDLVHADFRPAGIAAAQFPVGSNGLAGGNARDEAVLHGLLELIERDAVAALVAGGAADPLAGRRMLDWSTIDDPVSRELQERLHRHGVDAFVHDATTAIGIPAFYCRLVQRDGQHRGLPIATDGSGCHLDPAIALRRALTEAAQTRLLLISGARDDLRSRHYLARAALPDATGPKAAFAWRPFGGPREIGAALRAVQARLAERGLTQVIVVDLGRPASALAFVRVVVPGLRAEAPREGVGP